MLDMRIEEASNEMKDVLARCEEDISVPLVEINAIPEIKAAEERLRLYAEKLVDRVRELTGIIYEKDKISTYKYPAELLLERQTEALKNLENMGSAVIEDGGKTEYNGIVKREGHLDIVIGLPASGKSSAIVDTLSQFYKARIVDNDEAKKQLPEFNNGFGADLVHRESQDISNAQMLECFKMHENVVIPKVGSNYKKIEDIVKIAQEHGYKKINVHYVDLPRNKAMGRLLGRFVTQNRYLKPELIDEYNNIREGNKIEKTFDAFKAAFSKGGIIDGYAKWNNDVKRGESPVLEESKGIMEIERIQSERSGLHNSGRDRGNVTVSDQALSEGDRSNLDADRPNQITSADIGRVGRGEGTRLPESGVKRPSVLNALKAKQKIVEQYKADRAEQDVLKTHQPKTNEVEK